MPVSLRPACYVRVLVAVLTLLLVACGGTPAAPESTENPTPAPITSDVEPGSTTVAEAEPTEAAPVEPTVAEDVTSAAEVTAAADETAADEETASADVGAAGEEENAEGGFAYTTPDGWTAEALGNTVIMRPSDAAEDDDTAPTFVLEGGAASGLLLEDVASLTTLELLFDLAVGAFASEDTAPPEVVDQQEITVGGEPGMRANVRFMSDEVQMEGAAVVALAGEGRPFVMVGGAREAEWPDTSSIFDEVVSSVRLFEPTAAPEATLEPTAPEATEETSVEEPAQPGSSRSAPLALGTEMRFESWAVTVTETLRGDEAAAAMAEANQFNEPPAEGSQFVVVTLQVANISTEPEPQDPTYTLGMRVTGDRNVAYSTAYLSVPPVPLDADLAPGGTTDGQVVFEVPADEGNLMFMISDNLWFDSRVRFVAIDPDANVTPDPALADVEQVEVGLERDAPAKMGEAIVTAGFEAAVLEVIRGEEAARRVTEANEFNDPPAEGMEFVMLRVRVRNVDATKPDLPQFVDQGYFKIIGDKNEAYDAVSATSLPGRLDALLFPGGVAEGWVVLEVGVGEQGLVVIFQPFFNFEDEDLRYIALE